MNFKTTLLLGAALAALVLAYTVSRSAPKAVESTETPPVPAMPTSATARDVLEKKPGDVTKVVCQVKGKEAWTFEKKTTGEGASPVWRMTSPMDIPVASYEVDRFGRELGRLQYEISYKPGESGAVSLTDAGLSPPEAVVTLTDAAGVTATIEIGKPASDNETYVRAAGGERICVGKANLRHLYKPKALEYRDQQLWNFMPENVTRVEVSDRAATDGPVNYVFVKDGAKWMMQSPAAARATAKVDEMLRSLSRLRVTQWYDDSRGKLLVYGLEPAALSIRVTVEEKIAAPPAETEASETEKKEEAPPEIKTTVYELHVADRSPIGEDTKTYLRVGDESAVATIMKATTDKLKPVMAEWREMRITTANVDASTRVEMNVAGERAVLAQKDGKWTFEGDGSRAEDSAVRELLKAVKDMNAVVFVEADSPDAATYGFSQPLAEFRLTVPGADDVERITVGAYTDAQTRLMVYVRRNDSNSIGKVRSSEIAALLRTPLAYRDRTILDLAVDAIKKIRVELPDPLGEGRRGVEIERGADGWRMVEPVSAAVRTDRVEKLVQALTPLRATAIAAATTTKATYGLAPPTAIVTVVNEKPPATPADDGATESAAPQRSVMTVTLGEHESKFYAQGGEGSTVFEVAADFYKQLFEEFRTHEVLTFDEAKVREFSIRKGGVTHSFVRGDGKWTFKNEPDLPLDAKKVENLLLQLKDLKTERYVRNAAKELSSFGLGASDYEATVSLEDGARRVLRVSQQTHDKGPEQGHYACIDDKHDVFLLTGDMLKRIEVSLPELEKR